MSMKSVYFEIFGKVQGVYFRDNTVRKATQLGLTGNVRNRKTGTVAGVIQGPPDAVEEMQQWLSHTGSPKCRIDDAVFTNESLLEANECEAEFSRLPTSN
mmetsp:Transcript_2436/g.4439  ORF Transcript_2436/g.4439 Transcript_2436/m.4439 type:complete len:100 (-) Transcript_2436:269-568(-)|eukprot:CAMPEP_0114435428 /NCGR_PEP_ID=MMETSP0103-20121206/12836_1 /TAXON_ID=37642 ORGANISM="Paraphysomonas imperforata, Strain PA2" /NCGR_SAMPLE_ID=MMETSP0103 /ASSEMBLY_ACC=CAM_ASM_000201 /LENGTH=99 /DNA_ID=CAMNT_0001605475 /DNA_START=94 /DNA_END=393 /DNA_ORIENTATION=+